jgi:uncharacterized protein
MNSGRYSQGIALFDRADFFASHEALEDVWRDAPEPEKKFLQALIQTAVAFHHYSRGNPTGARSLLGRALRNLANYPAEFGGIELGSLRQSIVDWQAALDQGTAPPPLPALRSCVVGEK